jgi:hypothetical protein
MKDQKYWTKEDWTKYQSFLAEIFEYEDKYMAEYLADAAANY